MLEKSEETLKVASEACGSSKMGNGNLAEIFKAINEYSYQWIENSREKHIRKDFTDIFKKYINN